MKKFITFIFVCLLFFNNALAEKYWSNIKDGPTNIDKAETYIYQKYLDITPSGSRSEDHHPLFGIWYSKNTGFIGIYEESFKSSIFKMLLIKAPFGYGANYSNKFDQEKYYKSTRDHEGTIEATIIKFDDLNNSKDYKIYTKVWYPQEDGSYQYKTKLSRIQNITNDYFEVIENDKSEYFYKITPRIKKILNDTDSSKKISEFEIETSASGIYIYLDTKIKKDFIENKFINLRMNGDIDIGKIYRGIEKVQLNGIDYITCFNKGSEWGSFHMYYNTSKFELDSDETIQPKLISKKCDPLKIDYSTYMHYKNKYYYYVFGAFLIILIIILLPIYLRKKELSKYNKEYKANFRTYSELKNHKQKISDKEWEKKEKKEKKERLIEEKIKKAEELKIKIEEQKSTREEERKEKLESVSKDNVETIDGTGLMDKIKRLKKLYKKGTLTKAEFEKAKNKLLT